MAAPNGKPRDSIAASICGRRSRNGSHSACTATRKALPSLSSVVMSLKTIPGVGKSGTSRINPRSRVSAAERSIDVEPISTARQPPRQALKDGRGGEI